MAAAAAAARRGRCEFPAFPFEPYRIQSEFMAFLYDSLEKGGLAMLESPTGTGKTLGIICSSMQWLVDRRNQPPPRQAPPHLDCAGGEEDEEPDWMRDFSAPVAKMKKNKKKAPVLKSRPSEKSVASDEEMEFLVEEYESDEGGSEDPKRKAGKCSSYSNSDEEEGEEEEEVEATPKIYFTSRTHSQLLQFVKEFKRTAFASQLNLVCLGSRKNLCINSDVLKLGTANRINERCLELQKNKVDSKTRVCGDTLVLNDNGTIRRAKVSSGCPMLGKKSLRKQFKNQVQERGPLDIEDLVQLGSKIETCPYYGTRDLVRAADVVVLPYQSLLLTSARESLGLNLKNSIVIIDEAHNLADSLTSMYNAKVTYSQLRLLLSHLEMYLDRFRKCLGAANRRYIQILIVLAQAFLKTLLGSKDSAVGCRGNDKTTEKEMLGDISMTINEFVFSLDIDNINLVKVCQYLKESNIAYKVSGYGNKIMHAQGGEESIVMDFQAFADILIALVNNNSDGRIIVSREISREISRERHNYGRCICRYSCRGDSSAY